MSRRYPHLKAMVVSAGATACAWVMLPAFAGWHDALPRYLTTVAISAAVVWVVYDLVWLAPIALKRVWNSALPQRPQRRQFNLKALFVVTTWAAIAAFVISDTIRSVGEDGLPIALVVLCGIYGLWKLLSKII